MITKLGAAGFMNELQRELTGADEELLLSQERESASGEAMDSMERKYWEGYTEALEWVKAQLEIRGAN